MKLPSQTGRANGANGTNISRVLLFVQMVLFRKLIGAVLIGTYIHRVLVIDGRSLPMHVFICSALHNVL